MYSLPSTSHTRAPLAFWTKNGCPPTARNARTGELTPPGMYFRASANNASDLPLGITRAKYSGAALGASQFRAIKSEIRRSAQGAVPQDGILRYSRLAVCATNAAVALN